MYWGVCGLAFSGRSYAVACTGVFSHGRLMNGGLKARP